MQCSRHRGAEQGPGGQRNEWVSEDIRTGTSAGSIHQRWTSPGRSSGGGGCCSEAATAAAASGAVGDGRVALGSAAAADDDDADDDAARKAGLWSARLLQAGEARPRLLKAGLKATAAPRFSLLLQLLLLASRVLPARSPPRHAAAACAAGWAPRSARGCRGAAEVARRFAESSRDGAWKGTDERAAIRRRSMRGSPRGVRPHSGCSAAMRAAGPLRRDAGRRSLKVRGRQGTAAVLGGEAGGRRADP